MKVTIRGKRWDFVFVKLSGKFDGHCDSPKKPGKRIQISKQLRGRRRLETIIHECLHAGHWDLAEEAVEEMADDLSKILVRLGYGVTTTEA